jgi:galactonate dehydratase
MRVSQVSVFVVPAGWREFVIVQVSTEEGLRGSGESTMAGQTKPVVAALLQLAEDLVGRDARQINAHVDRWFGSYWRGGPILATAIAGLEIALWDICAQAVGVPVYQMLGGACRDAIPVYANSWFERGPAQNDALEPEELAAAATRVRDAGYGALKLYPFGYASPGRRISSADLARGIDRVVAVREAVGPGVDVMLDIHGMLTPAQAMWFAERSAPARPFWLEEPVPPEDLEGAVLLASRSRIPIALGERLYSPTAFLPVFIRRGCAIAQPDPLHVGGLLSFVRIAALASASHVGVAPHNSNGPIGLAACVHLAVTLPEVLTVEYPLDLAAPWRNDLVDTPYIAAEGAIALPSRPGLGLHLNDRVMQRHHAGTVKA